jgi:hypothetical protein
MFTSPRFVDVGGAELAVYSVGQGPPRVSTRRKLLILAAFAPVVAMFAWGASRAPLDPDEARETCLHPYYQAIDARRYDDALGYLTATYRQTVADELRSAIERHDAAFGKVVAREETTWNGYAGFAGDTGFHVRTWFRFERGDPVHVLFRVVHQEDGSWRIDDMGEIRSRTIVPGPW